MTTATDPSRVLKGKRVLVVEDEALVAMSIERMLADAGAEVVGPGYSLDEALRLARASAIDAAILDVNLRGERSYPVAELLRSAAVPFIFATGYGSALPAAGIAEPVVHKPFQERTLLSALVAAILASRRA